MTNLSTQSEIGDELSKRSQEQIRQLLEMLLSIGCTIVYTETTDVNPPTEAKG